MTTTNRPIRRALVSVFHKEGIEVLAEAFIKAGTEVVSTGSTAKRLAELGVKVTEVSEVTGFPECLDGRVKTLDPHIHAGILADMTNEDHAAQLEKFGIPVLVERSSYETDPLARMEWVKLYGILLGKQQEAEQLFDTQVQRVAPLENQQPTGKTVAFFSITSNNLVTVRKGSDYVARMIEMAGGSYVFADLTDNGNNLATINLSLEDFYAGAKDADVLLYNSTIEGGIASTEQLVEKCPLLAQFKAVQNGNVWCTAQSLFQQSMELPDLILDMNRVFTEGTPADSELTFLTHVE